MHFRKWLAQEKVARGLRQRTVAAELGYSASEISLYATGDRVPSEARREQIEAYTMGKVRAEKDWAAAPKNGKDK